MAAGPILRTPRLVLRALERGDAPAIAAGVGNYDVARWLAVVPYPYALADAEEYLSGPMARPGLSWAICDAAGLCGIVAIDGKRGEFGYWLARDRWGRGYATEAGEAVIDHWFADRRAADLVADRFAGNERSARVLAKLGFVPVGWGMRQARALAQPVMAQGLRLTRDDWRAHGCLHLTTPRLSLRPLADRDWRAVQRIGADSRVAPVMSTIPAPWPQDRVCDWIAQSRYRGRPGFRLGVWLRRRLIGVAGLGGRPATCALFLDPGQWGRGYGREALRALLDHSFAAFDLAEIRAEIRADRSADNPRSGALLAGLGFVEAGRATDRSAARLEPAPIVLYRLDRQSFEAAR